MCNLSQVLSVVVVGTESFYCSIFYSQYQVHQIRRFTRYLHLSYTTFCTVYLSFSLYLYSSYSGLYWPTKILLLTLCLLFVQSFSNYLTLSNHT